MPKLEVFFDYICPHCLRGHDYLVALLPQFPALEIEWRPCESHPRPEEHGMHSDLCARAMMALQAQGADLMEYHRRMYKATLADKVNVEELEVILEIAKGLGDGDALRAALSGDAYQAELDENTRLVWDVYDCPAVPSYRMGGRMLKSGLGVGVTKDQLEAFLKG